MDKPFGKYDGCGPILLILLLLGAAIYFFLK